MPSAGGESPSREHRPQQQNPQRDLEGLTMPVRKRNIRISPTTNARVAYCSNIHVAVDEGINAGDEPLVSRLVLIVGSARNPRHEHLCGTGFRMSDRKRTCGRNRERTGSIARSRQTFPDFTDGRHWQRLPGLASWTQVPRNPQRPLNSTAAETPIRSDRVGDPVLAEMGRDGSATSSWQEEAN